MLYAALILFLLIAALGLYMIVRLSMKKKVSGRLGLIHGIAGLATFGLLVAGLILVPHPMVINDAAVLFFGAAIMGIFNYFLTREGISPLPMAILHGAAALIAIALLLFGLIKGIPH